MSEHEEGAGAERPGWRRGLVKWQARARQLRRETYALYIALRDPRIPWYARLAGILVVGYAFSPIDLIPDFVPVLGYLDDLVILPLGIAFTLRLIPPDVMADARVKADAMLAEGRPTNWAAAVVIVIVWLALAALTVWLVLRNWR